MIAQDSTRLPRARQLLLLLCFALSPHANGQDVFVSPNGSDTNNGTSAGTPVRSFKQAADVAQMLGSSGIVVQFAGGSYPFTDTVVLDASHSGITFRAAAGEIPVFTSLIQVTGWTVHSGNVMRANSPLTGGAHVRYLQDASEGWMPRSETVSFKANETTVNPEDSYHDPKSQPNKLNVQHPPAFGAAIDWSKATQYDLRASQSAWNQELLPIASYSAAQDRITTLVPSNYEMRAHATDTDWPSENWVMNTIAGIDQPGEWAIIDDVIYLYPKSGTGDIYVPKLLELIRVDAGGDGNTWSGTPVQNITFDGITMTGADFYAYTGGDIATTHDWDVVDKPTALLRIRNASNSAVTNCRFTRSGGAAIRLDRHAQNITISNNEITHMGRGGISLIGRGPGYGDVNKNNTITGNTIQSIGREKWTALAINLDQSGSNLVSKNYIEDTYFSAIGITGPKQFIFMNHIWGTFLGNTWQGRDFHTHEFNPTVYNTIPQTPVAAIDNGTWDAMVNLYSGDNTVENNAFINTGSGRGYLIQSVIYMSGIKRHRSSLIRNNFFSETTEATTNSSAMWADSDQDNTDWIGNMVFNVDLNDTEPEPATVYRANAHCIGTMDAILHEQGDRARITANVTLNSTFSAHTGFDIGDFRQETGNATSVNGGDVGHLNFYAASWLAVCPGAIAGHVVPGAAAYQVELGNLITNVGGTVPTCPTLCTDLVVNNTSDGLTVIAPGDYRGVSVRSNGRTANAGTVRFIGQNSIGLSNGFAVGAGSRFEARLEACNPT